MTQKFRDRRCCFVGVPLQENLSWYFVLNIYLRQEGNVFAGFCLFVRLSVSKITQKVMDRSF